MPKCFQFIEFSRLHLLHTTFENVFITGVSGHSHFEINNFIQNNTEFYLIKESFHHL